MMLLDITIFVVQAVQLPLVALITLLILIIGRAIRLQQQVRNIESNAPIIVKATKWVAIGLVCNLLYLVSNIVDGFENIAYFKELQHYLIVLLDLMTTVFFYISFLTWFDITQRTNQVSKNKKQFHFRKLYTKGGFIILLILLAVAIGYDMHYDMQSYTITSPSQISYSFYFHLYNFFAYASIGYYFFRLAPSDKADNRKYKFKYFLVAGFLLWAGLQLLDPVISQLGTQARNIDFAGFLFSTISKILILCGFFMLYERLEKNALESQKDLHGENVRKLKELQTLINKISFSLTTSHVIETALAHLKESNLFQFDYAVFCTVNYSARKIMVCDAVPDWDLAHKVNELYSTEQISIDSNNDMANAILLKKIIHVVESVTPEGLRVQRFYIPIAYRDDKAIAVIEAGTFGQVRHTFINEELDIYIDNLAQTFKKINEQERDAAIEQLLNSCDIKSKDDPSAFLQEILEQTCKQVKATHGILAVLPNFCVKRIGILFFNVTVSVQKKMIDHFNTLTGLHPDWNEEMITGEFIGKVKESLNISTIEKYTINLSDKETGTLYLCYPHQQYFDETSKYIIHSVATGLKDIYNEKKFHHSVAGLVLPNHALTNPAENILPVINAIRLYLSTDLISVWLREESAESRSKNAYRQHYATDELKRKLNNYGHKIIILEDRNEIPPFTPIQLNTELPQPGNMDFWEFGKNHQIQSFIHVPLLSGSQHHGFINIYFKRTLAELSFEEKRFLNLIAVKSAMTLQVQNLVMSFKDVSASLTQNNLNDTLQVITDRAMELLTADPVILFKSKNGTEVFFKDIIFSRYDDFRNPDIINKFQNGEDHVELAELIVQAKSEYFNNEEEYKKYVSKSSKKYERIHFKEDFWHREGIVSMAAIRLENRKKAVGVMFINFRRQISFTDDTKNVIQTFADLAAGAIETGYTFERNRQYLLRNLRLSKPLINEVSIAGALHDANKTYRAIHGSYFDLIYDIDNQDTRNPISVRSIRTKLKDIELPSNSLLKMFTKLFSYYKEPDSLNIKNCNISALVEGQLYLLESDIESKLIKVAKNYDPFIYAECDEAQMGHVFYNLLNNACQAMGRRGNLEIRIAKINDTEIKVEVIDDGPGISKNIYDIILEPYVTDKSGGSGLGLAISKLVIEQHGGHIRYTSKEKRTKFQVFLPTKQKTTN